MNKLLKKIEDIQKENTNYNYIDILPTKIDNDRYFDLEEYLIQVYMESFSEKISNIIIKLISYYDAEIYLTEFPTDFDGLKYKNLLGKDIRCLSLLKIMEITKFVVQKDISSLQVYFVNSPFLISINGGFSVDIYGANDKELSLISQLVLQENLYLKETTID